jgi:hypothetical protein
MESVQPDPDDFIAVIADGADVAIRAILLSLEEVDGKPHRVRLRVRKFHQQQLCRFEETPVMIERPKNKQLLLVIVPIAAYSAKHACPIVQSVGKNADLSLAVWNYATLEKGKIRQSHCLLLLGKLL